MQCLKISSSPESGRDAGGWAMCVPRARGLQALSPAPEQWCDSFPPQRGPLSPHVRGTGAQRPTVDSCPPKPRDAATPLPPTCPSPPSPLRKAPAPAGTGKGAGAHHHGGSWRDSGETGRGGELRGGGATGPCVRVPVCVAHTPSCLCACQVCACPPHVPTRRVHVSVGHAPRAHPTAQPAAHSWARGAVRTAQCEVAGV